MLVLNRLALMRLLKRLQGVQAHVVIDHHPLRGPHPGVIWEDIRSSMGASSTIVYE